MSLDFLALNVTLHFLAQLPIFFKSLFSIALVSAGSTAEANNDVRICICLAEILWNLNFLNSALLKLMLKVQQYEVIDRHIHCSKDW